MTAANALSCGLTGDPKLLKGELRFSQLRGSELSASFAAATTGKYFRLLNGANFHRLMLQVRIEVEYLKAEIGSDRHRFGCVRQSYSMPWIVHFDTHPPT